MHLLPASPVLYTHPHDQRSQNLTNGTSQMPEILESRQEVKGEGKKQPLVLSTSSILKKPSPVSPPPISGSNDRNANVESVHECLYCLLS